MNKLMRLIDKAERLLSELIHRDELSVENKERILLRLKVMMSMIKRL